MIYDIHVNNYIHIKNDDDVIDDNRTYNNPFKSSTCIDNNNVGDTDCDCYNDHNNHINPNININMNIIACEYDNYDEGNNNRVGRYDVGLVKGDDLVTNNREENNDATSLVHVSCQVSSQPLLSMIVILSVIMIIT